MAQKHSAPSCPDHIEDTSGWVIVKGQACVTYGRDPDTNTWHALLHLCALDEKQCFDYPTEEVCISGVRELTKVIRAIHSAPFSDGSIGWDDLQINNR